MRTAADRGTTTGVYDGISPDELARQLGLPRVVVYDEVGSTLDVAHALAADGADAGTLIVAGTQTAGRGRHGRTWTSERGAGVWLTLIERPSDASALEVLSLRVGLALASAIERFADGPVRLKWPNDVYVDGRKLAGILVEARWRDATPEWLAVGVGINVRPPASEARAVGLRAGTSRVEVVRAIIPAVRFAASRPGTLSEAELRDFVDRDMAYGRDCTEPVLGVVRGIDARGALVVAVGDDIVAVRSGSLVLKEEQ